MNRRKHYTHDGVTLDLFGWSAKLGVSVKTLKDRMRLFRNGKISYEQVFVVNHNVRLITHNGVTDSIKGWADRLGVRPNSFLHRIQMMESGKWDEDRVFTYGTKTDRTNTRYVDYHGKRYTLHGIAEKCGVPVRVIRCRLSRFDHGHGTLATVFRKGKISISERSLDGLKRFIVDGTRCSLSDIARDLGLNESGISRRMRRGWTFEEATSEYKVPLKERAYRICESRSRNKRRRELRKMGLVV